MAAKRILVSMAVGTVLFGGTYGLAASLGVSSDSLGSGASTVVACQPGTVAVSYTAAYSASGPAGYRATSVTLGNLDTTPAACGGKSFRVTLTGPSGASTSLAEQTGTLPSTGTSTNVTFSGVSASDVTGVHLVVAG